MKPPDPSLAAFSVLTAVAVAGIVPPCLRLAAMLRRRWRWARAPLPRWLRALWPLATLIAPAAAQLCPAGLRAHLCRQLRLADLDGHVSWPEWCAAHVAAALGAFVLAVLAGGGPVVLPLAAATGAAWPALWLRERRRRLVRELDRALPRLLELLTLAVEAGSSLGAALRIGAEGAEPGALQRGLAEALRGIHAGRSRAEALAELAARYQHAGLDSMVAAIAHAGTSGAGIGATLRAQAIQRTEERFARAERLAMESPVKMLGPLILCIFPCAFLVIGFPIAYRLLQWSQG